MESTEGKSMMETILLDVFSVANSCTGESIQRSTVAALPGWLQEEPPSPSPSLLLPLSPSPSLSFHPFPLCLPFPFSLSLSFSFYFV